MTNECYEHWKTLYPNATGYEYQRWIKETIRKAYEEERYEVAQAMTAGDLVVSNHDNFTAYVLEQTTQD